MASGVSTTLPTRPVASRVRTVLAGWFWASVAIGSKQQISAMATRQRKRIAGASIGYQAGEDPGRASYAKERRRARPEMSLVHPVRRSFRVKRGAVVGQVQLNA